jgi:hypothetical protein
MHSAGTRAYKRLSRLFLESVLREALPTFTFEEGTEKVPVNVRLLDWWRTAAKDPDPEPVEWLKTGAPAGILIPVVDRGIFPTYDPCIDVVEVHHEDLHTAADFQNYAGVDGDPDIDTEVDRILTNEYAVSFKTLDDAEAALGGKVILSKIGAVKKWRNFVFKMRMVIDSKESGVSRATRKQERTRLPRASDVVKDVMMLLFTYMHVVADLSE